MFYSQTYLARKGPLGTVWCAAHLQHRLKKSHYTSTDLVSTVDRIMFPEVPIALRMSGHLLLGVVRIYSKKVHYLYHDCNVLLSDLRKAFTTADLNLPEDATTAKFEAVTLPQTFDLDALDVDDDLFLEGSPDNHLRNREDITLTDQIPIDRDPYIAISFDEDFIMDTLPQEQDPVSDVRPINENITSSSVDHDTGELGTHSNNDREVIHGTQEPGRSNQTEVLGGNMEFRGPGASDRTDVLTELVISQDPGRSNQTEMLTEVFNSDDPGSSNWKELFDSRQRLDSSPPEIEVMRDAHDDFRTDTISPIFPDHASDPSGTTEPFRSPGQVTSEKGFLSPIVEHTLASGGQSSAFQQSQLPSAIASHQPAVMFDLQASYGIRSPQLSLRSSPPVQQPQCRPTRKRKFRIDKSLVLSNKFLKQQLNDCSGLSRKRRDRPSSALDVWKLNKILRKEQVFFEPSVTGLSESLCELFKKDYISTKHRLTLEPEVIVETQETIEVEQEAVAEPLEEAAPAPLNEGISEPVNSSSPAQVDEVTSQPQNTTSTSPAAGSALEPAGTLSPMELETSAEIEQLRHDKGHDGNDVLHDIVHSPGIFISSPFRRDDFSPGTANERIDTASLAETSTRTEMLSTPDIAASTRTYGSEPETTRTFLDEQYGGTGLPDIPELLNSADAEELYFLEADSTPIGSQGTKGIDSLSVRTRAVAQFLRRYSPIPSKLEEPPQEPPTDLSLNTILEGKTRKLCARMFYETLVLKSYGLIDVKQEEPYSDITLKLTSELSKAKI